MKKKYIDSSSSGKEKENQLINKIKQVSYYSYLACTILDFKYINNAAEFETKLGLILHNLANRLFKSTNINNLYKQIKKEKLSLSDDEYNEILNDVIVIFNKYLNQFFNNIDKKSLITDKDYIDLFNFVFDKNVNLPQIFILKNAITITTT
ncbi:MAG TPA: hypothetical protein LFV90_04665 [Rickettsia endosymbiont of Columbicola hoogstraali]|nr:hypothetical protein [Rickettsia endosymbiont of Columbicola hoogstraali]